MLSQDRNNDLIKGKVGQGCFGKGVVGGKVLFHVMCIGQEIFYK